MGLGAVVLGWHHGEHLHETIHKAVDGLKAGSKPCVKGSNVAFIAASNILLIRSARVAEDNVGDLKKANSLRDLERHVVSKSLDKSREQRCADALKLNRLGVGERHRKVSRVLVVEELKVLVKRTESESHTLHVSLATDLEAQKVAQKVHGKLLTGSVRHGHSLDNVVVSIRNCDILRDIHLMKNITAGHRHRNCEHSLVIIKSRRSELHTFYKSPHFLSRDFCTNGALYPLHESISGSCREVRASHFRHRFRASSRKNRLLVNNINSLHTLGIITVAGKHGHDRVEHNLGLGHIRCRALNEHVPGVLGDLGLGAVDDRRQREDLTVAVVDHRVHRRIIDDVSVGLEVLALGVDAEVVEDLTGVHGL
mmetsp:Transcript_16128/g.31163  ORF Transcript_16128/g.31163 Transcript_16128/m.31163 type:complete len:367 (-) Transcript_16128:304-1404(-)